jgi:hypothetical protein
MSDGRKRSRAGRLVVYTVFWTFASAVTLAVLGSVAFNLYGRPPTAGSSEETFAKRHRTWCIRTLVGLRDELELEVTHELAYPAGGRPPMTRWNGWVGDWQARLDDATVRCSTGQDREMSDAYQQLRRLFDGYQNGVTQIAESRQGMARTLDDVVQRLSQKP